MKNYKAEIDDLQKKMNEMLTSLAKELLDDLTSLAKELLDDLAKDGSVSTIIIRGMTPYFNDGEPCEHWSDFFINMKQIYEEEMVKHLSIDEDDLYVLDEKEAKNYCESLALVWEGPSKEILSNIHAVLEPLYEKIYGTNYLIVLELKEGKWNIRHEDYEPDY